MARFSALVGCEPDELLECSPLFNYRMLTEQYRMHPTIGDAISDAFYGGRVTTSARTALSRRCLAPFTVVDTSGAQESAAGTSFRNDSEADAVVDVVRQLLRHFDATQVCVLSFYTGQAAAIGALLASVAPSVCIASVDSMQGHENMAVVVSCARSRSLGFLADPRRVNVALSRAQECLVVVGSTSLLSTSSMWLRALASAVPMHAASFAAALRESPAVSQPLA